MAKTIIVTGASKGLGLAVVRCLVSKGHNAVITARSEAALQELQTQHPAQIRSVSGDVARAGLMDEVVETALRHFGRLDGLVIDHGMLDPAERIADTQGVQPWRRHFEVNLFSAIGLLEAAVPHLRDLAGRIVLVSTGAATKPMSAWGAYCSSKAALKTVGEVLALEEKELTVMNVAPGTVDTDMQEEIRAEHLSKMDPSAAQRFVDLYNEGKLLPPEKPGNVIARLALEAPKELSGRFFYWNDPVVKDFQDDEQTAST